MLLTALRRTLCRVLGHRWDYDVTQDAVFSWRVVWRCQRCRERHDED